MKIHTERESLAYTASSDRFLPAKMKLNARY